MATIPQTLSYEFVDNVAFNTAFATVVSSIYEITANDVFFIPGLVNQSNIVITTNGNLIITVTTINAGVTAAKVLFQTGAISGFFGIVNNTTTNVYNVDLTSFVPVAGSQTVYIVAQYAQVQETSLTVSGPPPGHPDYSANFVPYVGYINLVNTVNVVATTIAPDNQVNIELCRVTLSAGQTVVSAVDTSHQVMARVNAISVPMVGDVTGQSNSNTISNLQGNPVEASGPNQPSLNDNLQWNGLFWGPAPPPTSLPPNGPAGGDLALTYPNPEVVQSSAATFTALNNARVVNSLNVDNQLNVLNNISAGGFMNASNAIALGQALMMGQFSGNVKGNNAGGFSQGYIVIPIYNSDGSIINFIIQWGTIPLYGNSSNALRNAVLGPFNFPIAFPNKILGLFPYWQTNNITTPMALESTQSDGNGSLTLEVVTPLRLQGNSIVSDQVAVNPNDFTILIASTPTDGVGLTGVGWISFGY